MRRHRAVPLRRGIHRPAAFMLTSLLKRLFLRRFRVPWRNPLPPGEQAAWQRLRVASASGASLAVWFGAARTPTAAATLVLGHPLGKAAKGYFLTRDYAELLRAQGYHVVLFDFNGFGESSVGSFAYPADIVAVGQAAQALTPGLPLGYFGVSLGAHMAVLALADARHPYQFALLESALTTLDEYAVHFPWAYRALRLLAWRRPAMVRSFRMVGRIGQARGLASLLLVYSETDPITPAAMGRRLQQRSAVPTELWTVPAGRHTDLLNSPHRAAYVAKLLASRAP